MPMLISVAALCTPGAVVNFQVSTVTCKIIGATKHVQLGTVGDGHQRLDLTQDVRAGAGASPVVEWGSEDISAVAVRECTAHVASAMQSSEGSMQVCESIEVHEVKADPEDTQMRARAA